MAHRINGCHGTTTAISSKSGRSLSNQELGRIGDDFRMFRKGRGHSVPADLMRAHPALRRAFERGLPYPQFAQAIHRPEA